MLIQNLTHGQRDNNGVFAPEKSINLCQRIPRKIETHEKAFLTAGPHHCGLELVYVGTAHTRYNYRKCAVRLAWEVGAL